MSAILSIRDLPINSKKILMRVDFNVPLNEKGEVTDDSRIIASLPSIRYVLDNGGALILMSHLGRPKDKSDSLSLKNVAKKLSELLGRPVFFAPDAGGEAAKELSKNLQPGEVLLLENLRFDPAEEKPQLNPDFAKSLAALADIYIDDAFGSAHRAHSSITEVPSYFAQNKGMGFLLEKEVNFLGETLKNPQRPFIAIVGGAKISSKLGVLEALSKKADKVLVGGAMAFTLLKGKGMKVGDSLVEKDISIPNLANVLLPLDFVCQYKEDIKVFTVEEEIPNSWKGLDIGPLTIEAFKKEIENAETIFWNGPMGLFEEAEFAVGTNEILKAVAKSKGITIVGGGDSLAAVKNSGLGDKITHLSTGGGASLEYIEYGSLPGLDALKQ